MADLVLEQVLPSQRASEIKELFERAGQPEFEQVFERTYLPRESAGLRSWLGRIDGQVVLHISVSPLILTDGTTTLTGAFLGDLMADETVRDFWGPLKLVRQMVSDVRKTGQVDFLLTTFLPKAEAVFKGGGFKAFADLHRYVAPLVRPYLLYKRLINGVRAGNVIDMPFHDGLAHLLPRLPSPGCFRPAPLPEFYSTRIPRQEYPSGTWLVVGPKDRPDGAVLVSPHSEPHEVLVPDILWRDPSIEPAFILASAARWLAGHGFRKMRVRSVARSAISDIATRAGCVPRPDGHGLLMLALRGGDRIPPVSQWGVMAFAGTGW